MTVTVHLTLNISQAFAGKSLDSRLNSSYVLMAHGDVRVLTHRPCRASLMSCAPLLCCVSRNAYLFSKKLLSCDLYNLRVTYVTFEKAHKCVALNSVTFFASLRKGQVRGGRRSLPPHQPTTLNHAVKAARFPRVTSRASGQAFEPHGVLITVDADFGDA
jgi:hypothetical protein